MIFDFDVIALQKDVFQVAYDHGWWDDCLPFSSTGRDEVLDRTAPPIVDKVTARIPEKLALIHSEIVEAHDEWDTNDNSRDDRVNQPTTLSASGKPEGFWTEIADVVIRTLDLFGAAGVSMETVLPLSMTDSKWRDEGTPYSVEGALHVLHRSTARALEAYRADPKGARLWVELGVLFVHAFQFAKQQGVDLHAEIQVKHAFNKTRSFRHGNKAC